jgi:hypothetical protein
MQKARDSDGKPAGVIDVIPLHEAELSGGSVFLPPEWHKPSAFHK